MTEIPARYYDGASARGRAVSLRIEPTGHVTIAGIDPPRRYALDSLRISSRVGNTPRSIVLPDGAKCEIEANDAIDALLAARGTHAGARLLHRLESAWPYALLLALLTAAAVWGLIQYGVPEIARRAAFALPVETDRALARDTLEILDRRFFEPSTLEAPRRDALEARFRALSAGIDARHDFRLELRRSPIAGPNAFALPDGTLVMTDALVALAERDEELLAVLAHEIGHVVHRHALRSVLQNSAVALLVAFALGDVVSVTSLAAALPTMLVGAKFSRDFEREADAYALELMNARNIPAHHATAILRRLEARVGSLPAGLDYLSSHPGLEERVRRFGESN
ncbi:MAG: M48 family metallopeptidase [Burkholderiales bacterium]|nr:M48 family metallopeptidase [Burkholderiales bacterium]